MRIGSISQGKLKCDNCGQIVPYVGRYLIVKETDGVEDEEHGTVRRYCVKCAREKGYVDTREEKGESILTFFQKTERLLEVSSEPEEGELKVEAAAGETQVKQEKEEVPEEDTHE